jgi:tetratricopeptide (TPR) repeat protein
MARISAAPAVAAVRPRLRTASWPRVAAALFGFLVIALLAAGDGGYWPTAWGWSALGFCWLAIMALLFRDRIELAASERAVLLLFFALFAWTFASVLWTTSMGRTVLEVERTLAYVVALLAVLLFVRRRSYEWLLGGIWGALWIVSTYALATRLFPRRLGVFDPVAGYRLSEPIGYWNALGIAAAIGALLALGFASRSPSRLVRSLAAASLLVFLPTVYFTFSRGAWIALGLGLACAIALDPRRLQLVTTALALAAAPALGLALAYRSDALTHSTASLEAASRDGQRLALVLAALAVANGLAALALDLAARRMSFPPAARTAYGVSLVIALVAALTLGFARYGSPPTLAARAYDTLANPTPEPKDLNRRFFTLSSRARVASWKTAWADFEDHRALGSGAGTYELYWARHRPFATKVRDAHSIYLETLAELGPVGLALVLGAFLTPVAAAVRARRRRLVPAAFAAYCAYLVHAGVDWDWEMTAVTMTALFCGAALLLAARHDEGRPLPRGARLALGALVLSLAAGAFVGVIGNERLAAGKRAVEAGKWREAEDNATKAMGWMPWSSEPWQVAGEAQLALGELETARGTLGTAIEKDPDDWELWLDLFLASKGRERRAAAARALRLNPLGPELGTARKVLAARAEAE